jgi:hypothetical protein
MIPIPRTEFTPRVATILGYVAGLSEALAKADNNECRAAAALAGPEIASIIIKLGGPPLAEPIARPALIIGS